MVCPFGTVVCIWVALQASALSFEIAPGAERIKSVKAFKVLEIVEVAQIVPAVKVVKSAHS
jgi:hypothetical protein